jgi:hypothetical protein
MDAVRLLADDHARLRALFAAFERVADDAERREIAALVRVDVYVHVVVEREIFYPALARVAAYDAQEAQPVGDAAGGPGSGSECGRAAVESLSHRLKSLLAAGGAYESEFTRLRCLVLAHCREEEVLLQTARQRLGEQLERIGWLLAARRAELLEEG